MNKAEELMRRKLTPAERRSLALQNIETLIQKRSELIFDLQKNDRTSKVKHALDDLDISIMKAIKAELDNEYLYESTQIVF